MVTSKEVTILNPFNGKARKRPSSKRTAGKSKKTAGKPQIIKAPKSVEGLRYNNPFVKETEMARKTARKSKARKTRKARNPGIPHPAGATAQKHRVTLRTTGKGKRQKVWAPIGSRALVGAGTTLNPFGGRKPRKRRSSLRRTGNPFALKTMFNKQLLLDTALIGGGFVIGNKLVGKIGELIANIPGLDDKSEKVRGLVLIALGGIVQFKVKNAMVKKAGAGLMVAGVYDLVANNFGDAIGIAPLSDDLILSGTDINAEMLGVDVQDQSFIQGDDLDAELFGSDSLIMSDDDI
jgi:hypothetical protein